MKNPWKVEPQKNWNPNKPKFHDDVINYEGAQLRAVYLVTAESAQPLHPGKPPESEDQKQKDEGVRF